MKIISVRNGFTADHSSTSYEFLALDRPLTAEARAEVAKRSRRAAPTERHVSFTYNAEGYDLPGGWQSLLARYYDVMVSESYDWWTFAIAFNAPPEQQQVLAQYAFVGSNDLGVDITAQDDRVIVVINAVINPDALYELSKLPGRRRIPGVDKTWAALLQLLSNIRQQLIAGDYRALYAVWEKYDGYEDEEEGEEVVSIPPEPPAQEQGQEIVERLWELLATL